MADDCQSLPLALTEFRDVFRGARDEFQRGLIPPDGLRGLLDGQAGAELRRLVPLGDRRRMGAFFTPHDMADRLAEPLRGARGEVVVADTSCGAGDLLLAAVRALAAPIRREDVTARLVGVDIVPQFAQVAEWRVELLCRTTGIEPRVRIRCGDGTHAAETAQASHLLLNPPFTPVESSPDCEWAGGSVNGAADFLARSVVRLQEGSLVSAVLPDVLRSGTRYRQWRSFIGRYLDIGDLATIGRFDRWADVDVFMLSGVRRPCPDAAAPESWLTQTAEQEVGDHFRVSVGPVVNFRAPHRGAWHPYLTAKGFPTWGTVTTIGNERRFTGRLHRSPFVVIPRTSRPEEPARARGAIVTVDRPVAVDNHLLVLSPRSGGLDECRRLLGVLRAERSNTWLNQAIRCRHLTVGAVASLPWADSGAS